MSLWSWLWLLVGALYFVLPLYGTFDFSLRARRGELSFVAYANALTDPEFLRTFTFSLRMAVLTIVVSILLIVPTAYWVHLRMPRLRPVVEFVTLLPFVIPAIVLVFGMIKLYSPTCIAQSTRGCVPWMYAHLPRRRKVWGPTG
jgi:putative spermidine/putrescine transport system permease protein